MKPWRILISLCITFIAYMIPLGHGVCICCTIGDGGDDDDVIPVGESSLLGCTNIHRQHVV